MGLPARLGGMAILNPSSRSDDEFNASSKVTAPLILLMEQSCKPTRGFQLVNLFANQGAWVLSPQGCFFDALAGWASTKTPTHCASFAVYPVLVEAFPPYVTTKSET